ncbi:hypothetical protein [Flavobacterium taihuense]|uniref:Uncharacterized protein n=1 Tax=Flavobacterium taihuense TaxID=2857508 RepID=A0ABS6XZ95_9FLAO|nr:hypothetical protein [Flavobacterium taihuense]MBW4361204.1 hypothetical protein [Flavobacterium taihuense]
MKSSFNITKTIHSFATYLFYLLTYSSFSQSTDKQVIRVEKMEYNYYPWVKEATNYGLISRVVLAEDSILAKKMKQSIVSAISSRWNATVLEPQWKLKQIEPSYKTPKLKTELKKGIPGNWHLFFQVTDSGPYPLMDKKKNMLSLLFDSSPFFENLDYAPYHMRFKAIIVDGTNGSEIFSNEMTFEMQREAIPDGQILLRKIPALTDSFLQAFDRALQNFFSSTPEKDLKLKVIPACLFLDVDKKFPNIQKLNFVTKNDSIIEQLQLKQEWIIQNSTTKKVKRVSKTGDNITNVAVNLLFGLPTDQITAKIYKTKFGFLNINENKHYSCEIPFTEENRVESDWKVGNTIIHEGGSERTKRFLDDSKKNYILCEKDTIGSFKITMGDRKDSKKHFSQYWDGKNESTISKMPEFWNNTFSGQNGQTIPFSLEGELNKVPFIIENSKAGNQMDIEISGQEIMTLKIYNNKPVFGLLYSNPTDEKILSILIMLSTVPFNSML